MRLNRLNVHRVFFLSLIAATSFELGLSQLTFAKPVENDEFSRYFPETVPPLLQKSQKKSHSGTLTSDEVAALMTGKPALTANVDWAQPPVGCAEEMVPSVPNRPCPDFSSVDNPGSQWPDRMSKQDSEYWFSHRRFTTYCRAKETLARRDQGPNAVKNAWMVMSSVQHADEKLAAVNEANQLYGVPTQVLTGAIYQESYFADLSIDVDGGNYSCGPEQINLVGWCEWAETQNTAEKQAMGWPTNAVNCKDANVVNVKFVEPFYAIAKSRLKGTPAYRMSKTHFDRITEQDVEKGLPTATAEVQGQRFQLVRSFIDHCSEPRRGILAKASFLASLYAKFLTPALKAKDRYPVGQRFNRACKNQPIDNSYPLNTGWLLAVAAYNAGPRAISAVSFYNRWNLAAVNDPGTVKELTPDHLVESLYWAGRYNSATDQIEFTDLKGNEISWIWYTQCVAQRHVAATMQNVTLTPHYFVSSLEGSQNCGHSRFKNGALVMSAVPKSRQNSPGQK